MQKLLASWIQAASTATLAGLAIWVGFFSKVGDLAIERLQSDLLKTEQQIETIHKEKEKLKNQKQQLQHERNELVQQREEHITYVVNSRLADLWSFGISVLKAYKEEAKLGQSLLEQVNFSRISDTIYFPNPENIRNDIRDEWGSFILGGDYWWKCTKNKLQIQRDSFKEERLEDMNMKYERDMADFYKTCLNEWEYALRQRIEIKGTKVAFTIKDFSEKLLNWEGISNAGEEVFKRIEYKLTEEISSNPELANLPIRLRVIKNASLQEIEKEANQISTNVRIARDWLDKSTSDRYIWTK